MCRCLVKFILFTVNLLLTLAGLAVVAGGILIIYEFNNVYQLPISISLESVAYIIIVIGVIVFVIAFLGCCGAATESKCLLITYAVFMGMLAAFKIIVTILLFVNLPNIRTNAERFVDDGFNESGSNVTFHVFETALKCCGTQGPSSYVNEYNLVPATCCETYTETATTCPKADAFETGCTSIVGNYVTSIGESIEIGLIVVSVWELIAMAFSIYIIRTIASKDGMVN